MTSDAGEGHVEARQFRIASAPAWRKWELARGVLRALIPHHAMRPGQIPIIHPHVKLRKFNGTIALGRFCELHDGVVISAVGPSPQEQAAVSVGDYTSIWYGTVVSARHEVTIGRYCAISWNCTIIDNDMHEIIDGQPESRQRRDFVRIGDHVWVGASAIVLKGVTIGANSVVAAGAIVTRDVQPGTLVAGVPAQLVRTIAGWR